MKEYEEIIRQKDLPNVGQTVLSKEYGTLWRVMEKREVWQAIEDDPQTKQPRLIPAIYLSYWRIQEGVLPGVGKMMGYTYTLYDNSFEANWEIILNYLNPKGGLEGNQGVARVRELPITTHRGLVNLGKNKKTKNYLDQEGGLTMGKVIDLHPTKKGIYRAAVREMNKMYQLSRGGSDPIIDDASREMFERGEIDEVRWKDWATYCLNGF